MAPRAMLQVRLELILPNVYFQPSKNVEMSYPAIVYERARADTRFADDNPYTITRQYQLTLISRDPDDTAFDKIEALPMCVHERFFVSDSLNHDVFNIYF